MAGYWFIFPSTIVCTVLAAAELFARRVQADSSTGHDCRHVLLTLDERSRRAGESEERLTRCGREDVCKLTCLFPRRSDAQRLGAD